MIIYSILQLTLWLVGILANIFGGLIPSFPSSVTNVLTNIQSVIIGGLKFISYFFNMNIVIALLSLIISFYAFKLVHNIIMKVIGLFIGN